MPVSYNVEEITTISISIDFSLYFFYNLAFLNNIIKIPLSLHAEKYVEYL